MISKCQYRPFRKTSLILAVSGTLPLFACSTPKELAACPAALILADTSSLVAFPPGAPETPPNEIYRIAVTNVTTDCDQDTSANRSTSNIQMTFHAYRHTGTGPASYTVPYFVTVTQGDQIVSKQTHMLQFAFTPGLSGADASQAVDAIVVQAGKDKKPADYTILIGLQLTKDQLDRNRRIGRYMP